MIETLNDALIGFRLDAVCVAAKQHRHFGFYDLKLGPKCQVNKIQKLASEIALRIQSKTVPIVKSIPAEGIVRLQVVFEDPSMITLDSLMVREAKPAGLLPFVLGETDDGHVLWNDMAQNPHMLVAGSTGSGKSIFLHNLIANALNSPNLSLFLVDPKQVEFSPYKDSTYKIKNIVSSYQDTIDLLEGLRVEMEVRYKYLADKKVSANHQLKRPMIEYMVIIDEISDLMLQDGRTKRLENLLVGLAQKSRAAGIYLVLATQRPSVKCLTGQIKANFEARVACRVSSRVDSQVILDHPGAESLLGRGDAIIKTRLHDSVRFQVGYSDAQSALRGMKGIPEAI